MSKMREWVRRPGASTGLTAVVLGVVAFCVYLRTLAPGCTAGDGPELATAMYELGVAHPTGYPLYTMLGHFFMVVFPFGTPIWKSNLLSAISAAAAVGVLFLVAKRVARRTLPAAVATLLFAFGLTFWSQAVITEVYAFHILLLVSTLYCLLTWDKTGDRRWLLATALCVGLSLTHHLTSIFTLPGVLYYALTSRHRKMVWGNWWRIGAIVAGCLLLYLYLPWAARSGVRAVWGDPRSWRNFVFHVTGAQYRHYMGVPSAKVLWLRVIDLFGIPVHDKRPGFLLSEFAPTIIWLAPIGLWDLYRRRRRILYLTVLSFVLIVLWSLNYTIPDLEAYYLAPYVAVSLWIGCGIERLFVAARLAGRRRMRDRQERKRVLKLASVALFGLPLLLLAANWQANDRRNDRAQHDLARAVLDSVGPNALVVGMGDDWVFPVFYVRYVEQRRRDVTVVVLPEILLPDNAHIVERLRSPHFIVNVPAGYIRRQGHFYISYRLLVQIIKDNLHRVPIYLYAVPDSMLKEITVKFHVVPGYKKVGPSLLPLLEVTDKMPSPNSGPAPAVVPVYTNPRPGSSL